jgi:predicted transcriptional regulator of viral defense system
MDFTSLMDLVKDEPVFTTGLLKVSGVKPAQITLQLVRWVKAGRLIQLRRGVYALSGPYRKVEPHPFLIANALNRASYVSLQSALAWYGMIPEYVPKVTSVTTGRPELVNTGAGAFLFRHVKPEFFSGFRRIEVVERQQAIVATPEKALVDLLYLTPASDAEGYLEELRLQNMESMNRKALRKWAISICSDKVQRGVQRFVKIFSERRQT